MGMEAGSLSMQTILFIISLLLCAVFSFLETSITALRLFKLKELAKKTGGRYKGLLAAVEKEPQRVLITILIANSLANTTSVALITNVMENLFVRFQLPSGLGLSIGIAVAAMAILVFGEILPKVVAKSYGDRYFKSALWLTNLTYRLFDPVASLLYGLSDFLLNRFGVPEHEPSAELSSEREIQFLIEHIGQKGLMEVDKAIMLRNIFELGKTPIKDIMVPATDIVMVDRETSIQDTLAIFAEHHFTRLPVYEDSKENIIGIVHLKDIFLQLSRHEDKKLKDIIRPILFMPESLKVNQLLRQLRQQHVHMAIVLNEHGIITGLITLEDLLEEIVGEISDEHELVTEQYITLTKGGWFMNAGMSLDEVSEVVGIDFEAEEANTLGGFLTEQLQHLPKKGERIVYKGYSFQVQEATPKRVLRVTVLKEEETKIEEKTSDE